MHAPDDLHSMLSVVRRDYRATVGVLALLLVLSRITLLPSYLMTFSCVDLQQLNQCRSRSRTGDSKVGATGADVISAATPRCGVASTSRHRTTLIPDLSVEAGTFVVVVVVVVVGFHWALTWDQCE